MSAPKSSIFRGENDELLDHLIFACIEHKTKKPLPSFGRPLEPYFPEGETLGPLPCRQYASCGSPPRSKASKARKAASPPAVRLSASRDGVTGKNVPRQQQASPIGAPQRGCPAFFSSPKPDSIPMPTTGLLSKAGSLKHVIGVIGVMGGDFPGSRGCTGLALTAAA